MPKHSPLSSMDTAKDIPNGPTRAEHRDQASGTAEQAHEIVSDPLGRPPAAQPACTAEPSNPAPSPGAAPAAGPEPGGDLKALMSSSVTETVRRQALRKYFHRPAFNRRDGLDDYDGDYRQFKFLGEVVTANLRHRIQRQMDGLEDSDLQAAGRSARAHPHPPAGEKRGTGIAGRKARVPAPEKEWVPLTDPTAEREEAPACGGEPVTTLLWNSATCAHATHALAVCSLCLEACAHGAIFFDANGLNLRTAYCSGCGACTSACPSGALHPAADDTLEMLKEIRAVTADGTKMIRAVFCGPHTSDEVLQGLQDRLPEKILALRSPRPAGSGPEAWLAALAMGAAAVIVLDAAATAVKQTQVRLARSILSGLKLDADARLLLVHDPLPEKTAGLTPSPAPLAAATWEPSAVKRELLWQTIDHLHDLAADAPFQVPLDPGSPLGEVRLEPSKCTLCLACVGACPTGALHHGSGRPRISFRERDCIQCGLCRRVCPEKAVTLVPRICYDRGHTRAARVLHQAEPLHCSVCGVPFATQGMVAAISQKLASHWMYQDQPAKNLLTMCRDCRIQSFYANRPTSPPADVLGRKK